MVDLQSGNGPVSGVAPRGRPELEAELWELRPRLVGYCYRMLGSAADADDAAQEAMSRAWRRLDTFAGRSSLRTWVYRITTNVCLDLLAGRRRRALPADLEAPSSPTATLGEPLGDGTWVGPAPTGSIVGGADPAERAAERESVRLAFVAALQHLPPRQRAVLILRDVLSWRASEVAELLGTTTVSVNSALQRARTTLAGRAPDPAATGAAGLDDRHRDLLARYVDAFERYDIEAFVALLADDVRHTMPPFSLWLQGPTDVAAWMRGPGAGCRGSRLVPVEVNGGPGFAHYRPGDDGRLHAFSLQVVELADDRVAAVTYFLDPTLFAHFGLPTELDRAAPTAS
ncbi:MAG: sigma-70 family RNA polymerase sigma factor [Actinomycetota bacterium]|nr:sigma-70 family RNA polymerase sigma factor [Actinomycetota bacterium]